MQVNRNPAHIPTVEPTQFLNGIASSASKSLAQADSFGAALHAADANPLESKNGEATDQAQAPENDELRQAFQDFVGQTFFSQMIASMRSTQEGAAYFNGGRAEKIFQGQLDQMLSEELSDASASKISDPMYKLFQLRRQ
jgi:Rod binding domain-containing protein